MSEATLSSRIFSSTVHALEIYGVYVGLKLGLYQALDQRGPLTPGGLAEAAGIAPRYAREWLEQQAVAGYLTVGDAGRAEDRRYALPPEHRGALCDPEDAGHVAPLSQLVAAIGGVLPEVLDAYRTGGGVSYSHYGPDLAAGQGAVNRPAFVHDLVESWLPAAPEIQAKLESGQPVRVVDVGCGVGWAAIAVARAYPGAHVVGVDSDEHSIREARANADRAGVDIRFLTADGAELADEGPFDLALVLEALHDMSRPVEVLASIRASLAPGGSLIIGDERAEETFSAPGDEVQRIFYGWSITHCLPAAMAEQPSEAIGTVIRPDTVADCARRAGFARCDILPVENELFRFYHLR